MSNRGELAATVLRDANQYVDQAGAYWIADALIAAGWGNPNDAEFSHSLLMERDQARMHAETLRSALIACGNDWPELPWL